MPLRICVYEDAAFERFYPLTILRPVYMLRAGIMPLFKRVEQFFPGSPITLAARDQLSPYVAELNPDYPVNIIKREVGMDVLFLNGRVRSYGDLPKLVRDSRLSTVFRSGDGIAAVLFKIESHKNINALATHKDYYDHFKSTENDWPDFPTTATLYKGWWEFVADIETAVTEDAKFLKSNATSTSAVVREGAHIINRQNVILGDNADVLPGSFIDATKGPVYVGPATRIEAGASIYGPCYIGANSVVVPGKVAQCSIGPTSRVGGEVEESIFQSYVNKFHAGFIGHCYVGSWVNFGAMTTNSDLKNNYSSVKVMQAGQAIDTGQIKVGSCIGDHTKTGIGTLLNTGISVGVCCNIFGAGLTLDKEVASFTWGNTGHWEEHAFDKAIETARRSTQRREVTLAEREVELLRLAFERKFCSDGALAM